MQNRELPSEEREITTLDAADCKRATGLLFLFSCGAGGCLLGPQLRHHVTHGTDCGLRFRFGRGFDRVANFLARGGVDGFKLIGWHDLRHVETGPKVDAWSF